MYPFSAHNEVEKYNPSTRYGYNTDKSIYSFSNMGISFIAYLSRSYCRNTKKRAINFIFTFERHFSQGTNERKVNTSKRLNCKYIIFISVYTRMHITIQNGISPPTLLYMYIVFPTEEKLKHIDDMAHRILEEKTLVYSILFGYKLCIWS